MEARFKAELQARLDKVRQNPLPYTYQEPELAWKALKKTTDDADFQESPETGIPRAVVDQLLESPACFSGGLHALAADRETDRRQKATGRRAARSTGLLGELLAYGSLLLEGRDVRMSGQDVKRGTFSHRHACIIDAKNYMEVNRLDGLAEKQGKFRIFNSLLSEYAVLGFEYGYSLATPDALVLVGSAVRRLRQRRRHHHRPVYFRRRSQMAAHERTGDAAAARLRRAGAGTLQCPPRTLSAGLRRKQCDAWPTSPLLPTFFHLLRRQLARPFRKPLVVMSPKSALRPRSTSANQ